MHGQLVGLQSELLGGIHVGRRLPHWYLLVLRKLCRLISRLMGGIKANRGR